jgi:hypothetical protein
MPIMTYFKKEQKLILKNFVTIEKIHLLLGPKAYFGATQVPWFS